MDHLLSMELFEIEKQPYENFGDCVLMNIKVLQEATFDLFYLVLRDRFYVSKKTLNNVL